MHALESKSRRCRVFQLIFIPNTPHVATPAPQGLRFSDRALQEFKHAKIRHFTFDTLFCAIHWRLKYSLALCTEVNIWFPLHKSSENTMFLVSDVRDDEFTDL